MVSLDRERPKARRGGYKRPYRTSVLLRDIIVQKGETTAQEVSSTIRQAIASWGLQPVLPDIILAVSRSKIAYPKWGRKRLVEKLRADGYEVKEPAAKRVLKGFSQARRRYGDEEMRTDLARGDTTRIAGEIMRVKPKPRHLPSRDSVRQYIYMAQVLGLIEYTGTEGIAHLQAKRAPGEPRYKPGEEAKYLSPRKPFRVALGAESSLVWSDLSAYYKLQLWKRQLGEAREKNDKKKIAQLTKLIREQESKVVASTPGGFVAEEIVPKARVRKGSVRAKAKELWQAINALKTLAERLPGTQSVLVTDLEKIRAQADALQPSTDAEDLAVDRLQHKLESLGNILAGLADSLAAGDEAATARHIKSAQKLIEQ